MADAEHTESTALLNEVRNEPVLKREEEVELFKRFEAGDPAAREEIVRSNLRFVIKIAYEFLHRGLPLADLVQEGTVGLLEVIPKFDWRKGFRFSTYAAFWVRQAIQMAVRRQVGVVRIPVRKSRMLGRMSEEIHQCRLQNGRDPTTAELAESMDLTPEAVESLMQLREGVVSLDTPDGVEGTTLIDAIPSEEKPASEVASEKQMRSNVERVFEYLGKREKDVLRLRYGFDNGRAMSLRNTSKIIGLSQEGVRRIERRALRKLRRPALRKMVAGLV